MKYYLSNDLGEIKEIECENDQEAFEFAQQLNNASKKICEYFREDRCNFNNWKAYNKRGDLIFRVAITK